MGAHRSKGCLTCVKRRVKCDEARPECKTCTRRGTQCPGYNRERKFVYHQFCNSNEPAQTDITPRTPKLRSPSSSSSESTGIVVQQQPTTRVPPPAASIDVSVAPGLISEVWKLQYRESFCSMLEGDCASIFKAYSSRVERNWVNVLRDSREETGNALSWAIRCIGSFRLGRVCGDKKQIIASREIYGRAIPALANAINNPSLVFKDETLAAATLLGTYEILNDDGQATWVTHSGGIGALIRLRGPKAHLDGFGRTLFLSFRPWLIFAAFMQGEKCFLEEDEWRETIPEILERERQSGKTSPLANTVECAYYEVARCPGYVAETRSLISSALFSETSRKKLIARITSTQQAMQKFRMDISEGLSPNAAFTASGHGEGEFAGAMPMDVAGIMGEYAVQTMVSATTLLQKLLVVLEHHRRQQQLEQLSEEKNDPWAVLNDNAPFTPESMIQSPPPDTLKQLGLDSKEEILVRVALSMGVMTETPPI